MKNFILFLFLFISFLSFSQKKGKVDPIGSNDIDILIKVQKRLTPDGSGINDVFLPEFSEKPKNYSLKIINKYNEIVFETTNYEDSFDGGNHHRQHFDVLIEYTDNLGKTRNSKTNLFLIR